MKDIERTDIWDCVNNDVFVRTQRLPTHLHRGQGIDKDAARA